MKENSPNKITVGNLHINLLRNKFDFLQNIIHRTWLKSRHSTLRNKLDVSFPSVQFILKAMLFIIGLTDPQMVEYCYF